MSTSNFAKPKKGNMAIYIILIIIVIASMVALKQCPGNMRHEVQTNSVNDTINVAIEYSPLSLYTYNDTLGGFSYDFMRMVEKHSGYKFIFHPFVKLEDALKALNKHEYDMVIAQFPITKENRDKYLFSNALYLDNQVLIQQKDSLGNVPIKSQLDIANDTVYIVKGSPMRSRLENLSHEIGDTIYIIDDNNYGPEQLFLRVATGEINYAVINEAIAIELSEQYPDISYETKISFTQFQPVILRECDTVLCDSLNNWIEAVKQSAAFEPLHNRYF